MAATEGAATGGSKFRVAVAQIAPTLGNLDANLRIHREQIQAARVVGADLVVFPELSLTGYYLRDQVSEVGEPADGRLTRAVREDLGSMAGVCGFVEEDRAYRFFNSAAFLDGGDVRHDHRKVYLPTYGMFDEPPVLRGGRPHPGPSTAGSGGSAS